MLLLEDTLRRTTFALGTAATIALAAGAAALPAIAGHDLVPVEPTALQAPDPAGATEALQTPTPSTYDPSRSLAPLVKAVSPAVVSIEVEGTRQAQPVPPMLREFLGDELRGPQPMKGEGSGFVISADGLVLTNHHVIDHADSIVVRFPDGTRVEATVLGSDADNDVALLRLPAERSWQHVELGNSDAVEVGDWVVAVGNPLGLGTSVTTGIISGKGRNLGDNPFHAFLQTDAAINRGNSGGPLFTLDGRVVGMNTAIIQYANTVGFAVPSRTLRRIVDDLLDDGQVQRGFVGIGLQPVDADLAMAIGLDRPTGAMITQVQPGMPGEKAGLLAGDVVTAIDGAPIADVGATIRTIGEHRPGDTIRLQIRRDGKDRTVKLTLAEREDTRVSDVTPGTPRTPPAVDQLDRLGVRVQPGSAVGTAEGGVRVLRVDAQGPSAGKLQPGDRIVAANKVDVSSPAELAEVIQASGKLVVLDVRRGDQRVFVAVPLG